MKIHRGRLSSKGKNRILERFPNEPLLNELLDRVWRDRIKGCWFINEDWSEYTTFYYEKAHRYVFKIFNPTKLIDGLLICHKCDRPGCVNPDHLFVENHSTNMKDARVKGRSSFFKGRGGRTSLDELRKLDSRRNLNLPIEYFIRSRRKK